MSNFQNRFIDEYNLALSYKLNIEQLSARLEIKPATARRYVYLIKDTLGIALPPLPTAPNDKVDFKSLKTVPTLANSNQPSVYSFDGTKKGYIITCAQNATPVHEKFLKSLELYATKFNYELLVIKNRYKNPTSLWSSHQEDEEWWDKRLTQYLVDADRQISPSLTILASIKIQPTATTPLSGFDSYTGTLSGIFGHPKVQLKTIPTPNQHLPKLLTTTGAVTIPNYTDSKVGKKGKFHHALAACVVEVDTDGSTFIRHVHADDSGYFYDLDRYVTSDQITFNNRVDGVITGDSHVEFIDPIVEAATFTNVDSICNVLNPKFIGYHDVEDFYPRNHHHRGNHLLQFAKHHHGRNNVEESLQLTASYIDSHTRPDCTNVIIKSNHDEALSRWLLEANPKDDPENALLYYYLMFHTLKNTKRTDTGFKFIDPFAFWCANPLSTKGMTNKSTIFLSRDESFTINGIEIGFHGDKGPSGSRGSIKAFTKIGPKTVIGHSHSPGIDEGVYQVGVSARLDLEYVSGPSGWMHTHCIIYANGKRTLIHIVNGKWKV